MKLKQTTWVRCNQARPTAMAGMYCCAYPFNPLTTSSANQLAFSKAAGAAMRTSAGSGTIVLQATDTRSAYVSNLLFAQQVQEAKNIAGSVRAAVPTGVKAGARQGSCRLSQAVLS